MKLFPELELLEDKQERQRVFKAASAHIHKRPLFWILLVGGSIAVSVAIHLALIGIERYVPIPVGVRFGIVGGMIGASLGIVAQYAFRRRMQKFIRTRLVEMGIPICIACGYELRGLQDARCPECGAAAPDSIARPESGEHSQSTTSGPNTNMR